MDILISSNLERLLLALTQDVEQVKGYMAQLSATGKYQVDKKVLEKLQKLFKGYCCDDEGTERMIGCINQKYDYLIDPHTAVAFNALEQYRQETGDQTPTVVVSTASPFKFCNSVLTSLGVTEQAQGLDILDQLTRQTGQPAPAPLASLRGKQVRFDQTVEKDHMIDAVLGMLE
jgi:threonine synthase